MPSDEYQKLTGDESWEELRDRAVDKFNHVQVRRGCGEDRARNPVSTIDLYLLGEANFLMALSEQKASRG